MKTPTVKYFISDCCNATLDMNEFEHEICTRCGHECGVIEFEEEYYDEVTADDERPYKSEN